MKKNSKYMLSIIVPVYNAETTLLHCLESILNQSYKDFELILVDDGSTDGSPALCDAYAQKDSRITVFHIENSGPFQARKFGAEKAAGEVLTFSDADDWLERDAFETAMEIFCENEPDILAYTYDHGNGSAEKHLYEEGLYCGAEIRTDIIPGMMYDLTFGGRRLNPSLCCKWIRRELFIRVTESVKDRITLGEDALVTYPAVCMAERIYICNKILYHYSVNEFSCTQTYPLERITEVKAFQYHMMRLFDEMEMLDQEKCQIDNYVRSFLAMMVRSWYGIELSPILFHFPYDLVSRGERVFVYGAGNVGKSYIHTLKLTRYAEIAGWADKEYDSINEYNGVKVTAPEQIKEIEFDTLLLAIWDETVAERIATELGKRGIVGEKIAWKKPVCLIQL